MPENRLSAVPHAEVMNFEDQQGRWLARAEFLPESRLGLYPDLRGTIGETVQIMCLLRQVRAARSLRFRRKPAPSWPTPITLNHQVLCHVKFSLRYSPRPAPPTGVLCRTGSKISTKAKRRLAITICSMESWLMSDLNSAQPLP